MKAWRASGTICFAALVAALVAAILVLFAAAVAVAIVSATPAAASPVHAAKARDLKQVHPFLTSRATIRLFETRLNRLKWCLMDCSGCSPCDYRPPDEHYASLSIYDQPSIISVDMCE